MDFGCGDGYFCSLLSSRLGGRANVVGFEPFMAARAGGTTEILRSWEDIERRRQEAGPAQIVTCFETLEHFSSGEQENTLQRIRSILADDGHLLISVPVEGGLPSVVKNLLRRQKYGGATTYSWKNIGKASLWMAILEAREGSDYLSHMGFYFADLEKILQRTFTVSRRVASPFRSLGPWLNSKSSMSPARIPVRNLASEQHRPARALAEKAKTSPLMKISSTLILAVVLAYVLTFHQCGLAHAQAESFMLVERLGHDWANERVSFPVSSAFASRARSGAALVDERGRATPFEIIEGKDGPAIEFLADLPKFGRSSYRLKDGIRPAVTDIEVEERPDQIRMVNSHGGVAIRTRLAGQEAPIAAFRLPNGKWIGAAQFVLNDDAVVSYSAMVKRRGPVAATIVCLTQFASGAVWELRLTLEDGSPAVLVDEQWDRWSHPEMRVRFGPELPLSQIYYRTGSGQNIGKVAASRLRPAQGAIAFRLEPWFHWWIEERRGNWLCRLLRRAALCPRRRSDAGGRLESTPAWPPTAPPQQPRSWSATARCGCWSRRARARPEHVDLRRRRALIEGTMPPEPWATR